MATIKVQVLTEEQKYTLADNIAKLYKFTAQYLADKATRAKAFGVVVNTPDNTGETLQSKYGTEQATHITNLVFRRLNQSHNQLSVSFDSLI